MSLYLCAGDSEEIRHFSEAKVERSIITLMEFESHLKFKRDVRYQSVRRGRQRKKGKSALYERNYSAGV